MAGFERCRELTKFGDGHERFAAHFADDARQQIASAEKLRDEASAGTLVKLSPVSELLDLPGVHDGDAIAQRERFLLVVSHENERDAEPALKGVQFGLKLSAQLEVQCRERFVEQQHFGFVHQRARQGDALPLAARKVGRPARSQFGDTGLFHAFRHATVNLGGREFLHPQAEGNVVAHGEMREERVGLKDGVHGPPVRGGVGHVAAGEPDLAAIRQVESGDDAEQSGLAATRGAEQGKEFAAPDAQADVVQRANARKSAGDAGDFDGGFGSAAGRFGGTSAGLRDLCRVGHGVKVPQKAALATGKCEVLKKSCAPRSRH